MKKYLYYLGLSISAFALVVCMNLVSSCEGPEGPIGPEGPAGEIGLTGPEGPEGQPGADGTPGVAGNAVCLECHNLTKKTEVTTKYNESGHASGSTAGRSTRNGCAPCHSHEGFVEVQVTKKDTTAAGIPIPSAITCSTCHDFHETLDFETDGADYALRTSDRVLLLIDSVYIDFEGSANLCVNCHQPRSAGPDSDDDSTSVGSHYGPHHSTQGTLVAGIGGYEVSGTVSYPDPTTLSTHITAGACVACHMHEGEHKWEPSIAACTECHSGATDFDIDGGQTEIAGLITTLAEKLETAGLLDDEGDEVIGKYKTDQVGALYNYFTISEDRSDGVHNYAYAKALLQNSIEVFP